MLIPGLACDAELLAPQAAALGRAGHAVHTSLAHFHGLTLPRRNSADLVLLPATGTEAMFGLPDSGDMPTIIAPDLSNLPAGETAINPETGEEFTRAKRD
jgi:hypothetical protein